MNADHDATMRAAAKAGATVTVTERPGYSYPANLTYWHTNGRRKGRARVVLAANGTSRTVKHHTVLLDQLGDMQ